MTAVVVELPSELRSELKDPMGPIFTDVEKLLEEASHPIVSVGDVVTYHFLEAGHVPAVALVDERTERTTVSEEISRTITEADGFDRRVRVENPAATLTAGLLNALSDAVKQADSVTTLIEVDGEEDLAALPAVVLAPVGSAVVYGQPGEGMVLAHVNDERKEKCRNLISRMDGDTSVLWDLLEETE